MSKPCEHFEFESDVNIGRITEDDGGPVTYFTVDLKVRCKECKQDLLFRGPLGVLQNQPAMSFDRIEARLPADIKGEAKIIKLN